VIPVRQRAKDFRKLLDRLHGTTLQNIAESARFCAVTLLLPAPLYNQRTNDGHAGKIDDPDITWELTNKAEALKKAAK